MAPHGMMLAVGAGLFAFGGAAFRVEPGTTLWWATRPLRFLAVGLATVPFVALLARFEWRISRAPGRPTRLAVSAGVALAAGACAAALTVGMADRLGQWLIPATALAGAANLRALPARPKWLSARLSRPVG